MEEVGVGGCTLTEHRVQPWHTPLPHKPLLPPSMGNTFSGGTAVGPQLKLLFLHVGSPSSPYLLSQAFPAPFPPSGSRELTEPHRHPALPSPSARSSTYSSRLPGRERCGFALSLFAALRARETCSRSEKDRSAPVSSWFVLQSTL